MNEIMVLVPIFHLLQKVICSSLLFVLGVPAMPTVLLLLCTANIMLHCDCNGCTVLV